MQPVKASDFLPCIPQQTPVAQLNILPGRFSTAGSSCDDDSDDDDDDDVAQPSALEDTNSDQHRGAGEGPGQGDATLHSYGGAQGPNHKASTSVEQRQEADPAAHCNGICRERRWRSLATKRGLSLHPHNPTAEPPESPLPCRQQQPPFLREKNLRGSANG
ncbi:UNVERIFIED_CONTAM: hypothetical protein FKN15_029089 [Acipenser sinensis]